MDENTDFDALLLNDFDAISQSLPDNDQSARANICSYYALLVFSRFQRSGQTLDLKEAIEKATLALQGTTLDDENYAGRLSNLGVMLGRRYDRTGKIEDLEEAIRVSRQAVGVTPEDYPNLAGYLNNLGNKLDRRYKRTGKIEDLKEAIRVSQQAVEARPKDHPDLAGYLNNLGSKLESRYERTGKIEDLEEAIRVSRQAVEVTPKDHPDLAGRLNNLGNQLCRRYERTGKIEDLEEAIRVSRQAVEVTPEDHPDLAGRLNNLACQLLSSNLSNNDEPLLLLLQAWNCSNAAPLVRIRVTTPLLLLLRERGDYDTAYKLSVDAIDLLPRVHNRTLSLQDKQYVVSLFSGLATDACSLTLQTGEPPTKAVGLLERGRGVILSLLMDDRSDTAELEAADSTLCELYESLRLEVNKPIESIADHQAQQAALKRRPQAIEELENCIQDIRKLPSFGQFQKGLTEEQMKKASRDGSIVIVNISDLRSDAIVVSNSGLRAIPLPGLDSARAKRWIN